MAQSPHDVDGGSASLLGEVRQMVENEFAGERYLSFVYGSYAYGAQRPSSDLDIVMVGESADGGRVSRMTSAVVKLHLRHGLSVDEEVPFHRKLVATWDDLQAAIMGRGFRRDAGRLIASRVVKSREFLESEELRLRLLLNAITGRCLFVAGDAEALRNSQYEARINWVRILTLLLGTKRFTVGSFVGQLIGSGERQGEWFLGFTDDHVRRAYLEEVFGEVFTECARRGWLREAEGSYEIADENWMRELLRIPSSL